MSDVIVHKNYMIQYGDHYSNVYMDKTLLSLDNQEAEYCIDKP